MADPKLLNDASNGTRTDDVTNGAVVTSAETSSGKKKNVFNVKSFVAIISLLGIFLTTEQMLRFSVLTTLERRFSFTTSHNGIIVSAYDIGHVVLLVILSIYGSKVHRPRMCALGGFLSAVSGLLWAAPHLIYGSGIPDISGSAISTVPDITSNHSSSLSVDLGVVLCTTDIGYNNLGGAPVSGSCGGSGQVLVGNVSESSVGGAVGVAASTETTVAFTFLFLSQCLLGAGLAPFLTVAITYLDDNTDPATSALGVSIFLSVASIGLVFGFLLGAAMTGVFVDITPTSLVPTDPEWIGAWWFGSVCITIATLCVSIPLVLFPRSLQKPEVTSSSRSRNASGTSVTSASKAEKMRPMLQRRVASMRDITDVKDVPKNTKNLATNMVYLCTTFAMCAITFLPSALFPFLPKYLETQFGVEPMTANIITSIVTALAVAAGTFTGGYIASAMELTPLGSAKLVLIGLSIATTAFTVAIFLGCPTPVIQGMPAENGNSLASSQLSGCSGNCSCTNAQFLPVCGGGENFYSACHAGCIAVSDDLSIFHNCSCLGEGLQTEGATAGLCDSGCSTMIPYAVLIFITTFTCCMGTSPIVAILIRSVAPHQKSIALGINNVLTSVLAAIPGPIIYGKMIDSTCSMSETSCEGLITCILYDNDKFRLLLHGVTEVFIILTFVCIFIAFISLKRASDRTKTEQNKEQSANMEASAIPEAEPMVKSDQRV